MSEKTEVSHGPQFLETQIAQAKDALRQARDRVDALVQREGTLVDLLRRTVPHLEARAEALRAIGDQKHLTDFLHLDMLLMRVQRATPPSASVQAAHLEQELRRAHVVNAAGDFVDADRNVDELEGRAEGIITDAERDAAELRFGRAWVELQKAVDDLRARRAAAVDPLAALEAGRG